jgi:hypothetical protein
MLNRDTPATAIRVDNGVDEPINHPGLSKLEYAAIHFTAAVIAANPEVSVDAAIYSGKIHAEDFFEYRDNDDLS